MQYEYEHRCERDETIDCDLLFQRSFDVATVVAYPTRGFAMVDGTARMASTKQRTVVRRIEHVQRNCGGATTVDASVPISDATESTTAGSVCLDMLFEVILCRRAVMVATKTNGTIVVCITRERELCTI